MIDLRLVSIEYSEKSYVYKSAIDRSYRGTYMDINFSIISSIFRDRIMFEKPILDRIVYTFEYPGVQCRQY